MNKIHNMYGCFAVITVILPIIAVSTYLCTQNNGA